MDKLKWLLEQPQPEEIQDNTDGSQYLPIGIVETKLRQFDPAWSANNFTFLPISFYDGTYLNGSIEVTVSICFGDGGKYMKVMVGAATIKAEDYLPNTDWAATLKAECIKNAVKALGAQFGSELNGRVDVRKDIVGNKQRPRADKIVPDANILEQYREAVAKGNEKKRVMIEAAYDLPPQQ